MIEDGSEISIDEFVVYGRPLNCLRTELDQDVADGVAWESDTIEGLAEQLGQDLVVLAQTVGEYNAACDAAPTSKMPLPDFYVRYILRACLVSLIVAF